MALYELFVEEAFEKTAGRLTSALIGGALGGGLGGYIGKHTDDAIFGRNPELRENIDAVLGDKWVNRLDDSVRNHPDLTSALANAPQELPHEISRHLQGPAANIYASLGAGAGALGGLAFGKDRKRADIRQLQQLAGIR